MQDTLTVESFDDPKVKGVTLYVSNFERPLTERIQKDFFTEPSYASVTAVKTGPIEVADNINKDKGGEVSLFSMYFFFCFCRASTHCISSWSSSPSMFRNQKNQSTIPPWNGLDGYHLYNIAAGV